MNEETEVLARRATDIPPDAPWWARWLVANFNEAYKWASVWWPAFCAGCLEVYAQNPDEINAFVQSHIPASWWPHVLAGAFVVSMAVRVVSFAKIKTPVQRNINQGD